MSTPGTLPNHWIGLTHISSEDYDVYTNFGET